MKFGVCVATKIDDVEYIGFAEKLGYSHAWVADSQMIWSDCFTVLALAAKETTHIQLGTGVAVAGTRPAPVIAHSIATINRLAPGRTFLGIGTGNTAMRIMGRRPLRIDAFANEIRTIRGLLAGETINYSWQGESTLIQFQMPELGFINIDDGIPIYISGFGPKTQALAGEIGDGLVVSIPPDESQMHRAIMNVERGAATAEKTIDPDKYMTCSLTMAAILKPGETLMSERIVNEVGPFALASLHYVYDRVRQLGGSPPSRFRGVWEKYISIVESIPLESRHLRVHAGHCTYIVPEERELITPELIRASCLVGTPDEITEQIFRLQSAGLQQIMFLPSLETQRVFLQEFSDSIMSNFE